MRNNYTDSSVQKGDISGFHGCIDHASAIKHLIREAKINGSDVTVIWLDLANTYGFLPHSLIFEDLKLYHIPDNTQKQLLQQHKAQVLSQQHHHIMASGIVTGCTYLSAIICDRN